MVLYLILLFSYATQVFPHSHPEVEHTKAAPTPIPSPNHSHTSDEESDHATAEPETEHHHHGFDQHLEPHSTLSVPQERNPYSGNGLQIEYISLKTEIQLVHWKYSAPNDSPPDPVPIIAHGPRGPPGLTFRLS